METTSAGPAMRRVLVGQNARPSANRVRSGPEHDGELVELRMLVWNLLLGEDGRVRPGDPNVHWTIPEGGDHRGRGPRLAQARLDRVSAVRQALR